mmetsp:Transcript_44726/g.71858  ORF Transcript_44726/g.71858 Transcript_44726/m.71858 type:complete len:91 (-) Transcript_44726:212-484(-)
MTEVQCAKRMPEGVMKSVLLSLESTWKRNNHISEDNDDADVQEHDDRNRPHNFYLGKGRGGVSFLPTKCAIVRRAVAFMRLALTCDTITT